MPRARTGNVETFKRTDNCIYYKARIRLAGSTRYVATACVALALAGCHRRDPTVASDPPVASASAGPVVSAAPVASEPTAPSTWDGGAWMGVQDLTIGAAAFDESNRPVACVEIDAMAGPKAPPDWRQKVAAVPRPLPPGLGPLVPVAKPCGEQFRGYKALATCTMLLDCFTGAPSDAGRSATCVIIYQVTYYSLDPVRDVEADCRKMGAEWQAMTTGK